MVKKILIVIAVVFVGIQFVSVDKSVVEADPQNDFIVATNAPENVANTMVSSCYDCHSNQTNYPWYSNVAPISWWVQDHVNEGREELNFSEWKSYSDKRKKKKLEEIIEEVEEKEMPLSSYTIAHSNAKLSEEQEEDLIKWVEYLQMQMGDSE